MNASEAEVVVVGAGAAGIAAARTLVAAGVKTVLLEARDRVGGRAWTVRSPLGFPIDLGCGWLHSAERNPWRAIAEARNWAVDHAPPPWLRPVVPRGEPPAAQAAFGQTIWAFRERIAAFPESEPDRPASTFVAPDDQWRAMMEAVSTFYSGAELERISARDLARFTDTALNWRVVRGYGALVADHAAGLVVKLSTSVTAIDHGGRRLRIESSAGALDADYVIVTLPTNLIAATPEFFRPALPEKIEAAAALPLGLADKLYLSLDGHEEFRSESRIFGRTDRVATAAYHFRPLGRPLIEAYFGGETARALEAGGRSAFMDFAVAELVSAVGSDMAHRVRPLAFHGWAGDPFARGSYSYARPGHADDRARLAEPVEERIFFAGEACSEADYSTAHGAYITGVKAAADVLNGLG
jgi:monoamine oxidase